MQKCSQQRPSQQLAMDEWVITLGHIHITEFNSTVRNTSLIQPAGVTVLQNPDIRGKKQYDPFLWHSKKATLMSENRNRRVASKGMEELSKKENVRIFRVMEMLFLDPSCSYMNGGHVSEAFKPDTLHQCVRCLQFMSTKRKILIKYNHTLHLD